MKDLIKGFSLEKVQKSGAVFNIQKLDYLNGYYIRQKSLQELAELCQPYLPKTDHKLLERIVAIYQERLKKLSEISELTDFFFKDKLNYDKELLRWKNMEDKELVKVLDNLVEMLYRIERENWTKDNLHNILMPEAEKIGDRGCLLWPLRVALSGKKASAGPFEIAEILGREKTLTRIRQAKELMK